MNKLLLLLALISLPVMAQEKPKAWIYGGLDIGVGSQKSDGDNENSTDDGKYFGAQVMGQYRFDKINVEAGLGWLDYKVSTKFKTGTYERVRLHTEAPYVHTGAFYKLTESFSLGLVANFVLDSGVLISAKDKSTFLGGVGAYYNMSLSPKIDMRIGAVVQKSIDYLNRDLTMYGLNIQFGTPITRSPAPVMKKNQTEKATGVIQTKREITLVTLDETLINFETASYELDIQSKALLADLGAFLASNTDIWESLQIEGHTDLRGGVYYNNALSVKRAHSVYQELLSLSLDKSRLSFEGSGYEKPLDSNIGVEAFAKNRRVDLKFVNVSNKMYFNAFIRKLKQKYHRNN